ncbi:regulatory protein YcgZ [Escherichia coli]|nr:regulatory protein YcgZ [Escherichia coli]MCM5284710.1 regulatory protein YcgZ [Escherichia coli]MCM5312627.1 regulatory protein YcgZ [Escherichia coli]
MLKKRTNGSVRYCQYTSITRYFAKANLPTQQETLGEIVTEILKDGRNLSRKSLCAKLLCRLEHATGEEEQKHYNALIGLLFE